MSSQTHAHTHKNKYHTKQRIFFQLVGVNRAVYLNTSKKRCAKLMAGRVANITIFKKEKKSSLGVVTKSITTRILVDAISWGSDTNNFEAHGSPIFLPVTNCKRRIHKTD